MRARGRAEEDRELARGRARVATERLQAQFDLRLARALLDVADEYPGERKVKARPLDRPALGPRGKVWSAQSVSAGRVPIISRNLSLDLPHRRLTVVTGVSGSGKSSLVFDTIYAEGQRRYVQSLSTYARLFLERMERPDVDSITEIPPALALRQKNTIKNARSTVGTVTEINDYLRLLFASVGRTICPRCQLEVTRDTVEGSAAAVSAIPDATFSLRPSTAARVSLKEASAYLIENGYHRLFHRREIVETADLPNDSRAMD